MEGWRGTLPAPAAIDGSEHDIMSIATLVMEAIRKCLLSLQESGVLAGVYPVLYRVVGELLRIVYVEVR